MRVLPQCSEIAFFLWCFLRQTATKSRVSNNESHAFIYAVLSLRLNLSGASYMVHLQ